MGEYLDQDSGFYHLRAGDYNPKIGRFVSRDSFEGNQRQMLSLNSYIYAHANPINELDPSGKFTLGGMMNGINNMVSLSLTAIRAIPGKILNILRKKKVYDIYDYMMIPLHFYMFAQNKLVPLSGIRYDVGNAVRWGGMKQVNPFGVVEGGFVRSMPASKKSLKGKGIKVTSHTWGQWLVWHYSVLGTEQVSCTIDKPYSFNPIKGSNCLSWTVTEEV